LTKNHSGGAVEGQQGTVSGGVPAASLRARRDAPERGARVRGVDHAYLSRMVAGKASVNPRHAERIAVHLGLPGDYFPEVREEAVIAAIRANARLRDDIYFNRVQRSYRRAKGPASP
jgi:hypothetical protein